MPIISLRYCCKLVGCSSVINFLTFCSQDKHLETCLRSVFELGMEEEVEPESHDPLAADPCNSESLSETEISFRSPEVIKQNLAHLDASETGNEAPMTTESSVLEPRDVEMSFDVDTKCVSTPLPAKLKNCPQCDFVSKSEKRVTNHVLIKHLGQKTYKKRNKTNSSTLNDNDQHGDEDSSDGVANPEANQTQCSDCLTIESKADLTAHILDSHVEEQLISTEPESSVENPASIDSLIAFYAQNDSKSDQGSNEIQEETAAMSDEAPQPSSDEVAASIKKPKQRGRPRKNKLENSTLAVPAASAATDEQPDEKKESDPEMETARNDSTLEDESFLVPPPTVLYATPPRKELLKALKLLPTVKEMDWNFLQAACGLELQLNKQFLKTGEKTKARRIVQRQLLAEDSSKQPAGAPTGTSFASTDCSSSCDNATANDSSVMTLDDTCNSSSSSNSLTADGSSTMTDEGTEMSQGQSASSGMGKLRKNLNSISLNFVSEDESLLATCNLGEPVSTLTAKMAETIHNEGKICLHWYFILF